MDHPLLARRPAGPVQLRSWPAAAAAGCAVILVIAPLAIAAGWLSHDRRNPVATGSAIASADVELAGRGWRWESYAGVQLTVPASWTWGVTGSPWCTSRRPQLPTVGRPGPVWAVRCATIEPPVALRAAHAWLQPAREPTGVSRDMGAGWREY